MLTSPNGAKGPARLAVAVRLSPAGIAEIDAAARAEDRSRSAMIRVLLREAMAARQRSGPRVLAGRS